MIWDPAGMPSTVYVPSDAVLAFGSIIVGKYWAYSALVDQFQETISGISEFDEGMQDYYEESLEDARLLVDGSGSDIFIRRFMVERGYTYETDPASISDAEVEDFREYVEPELRAMAENPPDFDEWQASSMESLDELSPWEMIPANDKNFARVKVLETFGDYLEAALRDSDS